jgi:uncharacterized protein YndB with AHSA1/START domain
MAEIRVAAERDIEGSAEHVYTYISDFRQHHPYFLPPNFTDFRVESGGVGEGTVTRFNLNAGGRKRTYHMRVSEPQPGSVLEEHDLDSSLVTTFTVTPRGTGSHVRIETVWQGASGVGGFFERTFAPRVMQGIYTDELERLDRYARERGG